MLDTTLHEVTIQAEQMPDLTCDSYSAKVYYRNCSVSSVTVQHGTDMPFYENPALQKGNGS